MFIKWNDLKLNSTQNISSKWICFTRYWILIALGREIHKYKWASCKRTPNQQSEFSAIWWRFFRSNNYDRSQKNIIFVYIFFGCERRALADGVVWFFASVLQFECDKAIKIKSPRVELIRQSKIRNSHFASHHNSHRMAKPMPIGITASEFHSTPLSVTLTTSKCAHLNLIFRPAKFIFICSLLSMRICERPEALAREWTGERVNEYMRSKRTEKAYYFL